MQQEASSSLDIQHIADASQQEQMNSDGPTLGGFHGSNGAGVPDGSRADMADIAVGDAQQQAWGVEAANVAGAAAVPDAAQQNANPEYRPIALDDVTPLDDCSSRPAPTQPQGRLSSSGAAIPVYGAPALEPSQAPNSDGNIAHSSHASFSSLEQQELPGMAQQPVDTTHQEAEQMIPHAPPGGVDDSCDDFTATEEVSEPGPAGQELWPQGQQHQQVDNADLLPLTPLPQQPLQQEKAQQQQLSPEPSHDSIGDVPMSVSSVATPSSDGMELPGLGLHHSVAHAAVAHPSACIDNPGSGSPQNAAQPEVEAAEATIPSAWEIAPLVAVAAPEAAVPPSPAAPNAAAGATTTAAPQPAPAPEPPPGLSERPSPVAAVAVPAARVSALAPGSAKALLDDFLLMADPGTSSPMAGPSLRDMTNTMTASAAARRRHSQLPATSMPRAASSQAADPLPPAGVTAPADRASMQAQAAWSWKLTAASAPADGKQPTPAAPLIGAGHLPLHSPARSGPEAPKPAPTGRPWGSPAHAWADAATMSPPPAFHFDTTRLQSELVPEVFDAGRDLGAMLQAAGNSYCHPSASSQDAPAAHPSAASFASYSPVQVLAVQAVQQVLQPVMMQPYPPPPLAPTMQVQLVLGPDAVREIFYQCSQVVTAVSSAAASAAASAVQDSAVQDAMDAIMEARAVRHDAAASCSAGATLQPMGEPRALPHQPRATRSAATQTHSPPRDQACQTVSLPDEQAGHELEHGGQASWWGLGSQHSGADGASERGHGEWLGQQQDVMPTLLPTLAQYAPPSRPTTAYTAVPATGSGLEPAATGFTSSTAAQLYEALRLELQQRAASDGGGGSTAAASAARRPAHTHSDHPHPQLLLSELGPSTKRQRRLSPGALSSGAPGDGTRPSTSYSAYGSGSAATGARPVLAHSDIARSHASGALSANPELVRFAPPSIARSGIRTTARTLYMPYVAQPPPALQAQLPGNPEEDDSSMAWMLSSADPADPQGAGMQAQAWQEGVLPSVEGVLAQAQHASVGPGHWHDDGAAYGAPVVPGAGSVRMGGGSRSPSPEVVQRQPSAPPSYTLLQYLRHASPS